jgi:hypothetical protein
MRSVYKHTEAAVENGSSGGIMQHGWVTVTAQEVDRRGKPFSSPFCSVSALLLRLSVV